MTEMDKLEGLKPCEPGGTNINQIVHNRGREYKARIKAHALENI